MSDHPHQSLNPQTPAPLNQPQGWRRRLAQARAVVWTAFALSAIALAALVGLTTVLLPYAGHFAPQLSAFLADRLDQAVSIESLSGRWQGPGPRFTISNLKIGSGADALLIEAAELNLDIMAWIRPGVSATQLFLLNDQIQILRGEDGNWMLAGLPARGQVKWQNLPVEIGFRTRELLLRDAVNDIELVLPQVEVSLRPAQEGSQIRGTIDFADAGQTVFTVQSNAQSGAALDLYVKNSSVALANWFAKSRVLGARFVNGVLDGELWVSLQGGRISDLAFSGSVKNLVLSGSAEGPGGEFDTRFALDQLAGLVQYSANDTAQTLALSDVQVTSFGEPWAPLDGTLQLTNEGHWALAASYLKIGDLARFLSATNILPADKRETLFKLSPNGEIARLELTGSTRTGLAGVTGRAGLRELAWLNTGRIPGVAGLGFESSIAGGMLTLAPVNITRALFTAPALFRWPLSIDRLNGEIHVDLAGQQPRIFADNLDLQIGTAVARARIEVVANGGRPFVDLRGWVSEGQVEEARFYWPHNKFSPRLVEWLDRALVGGEVRSGTAILYGDLDDWPFRQGEGRFEARAAIENGLIDYHPAWQEADQAEVDLRIDQFGLHATAQTAKFGNLPVGPVELALEDYRNPIVSVDVAGAADAEVLLRFLRQTPIYPDYAQIMQGTEASGPASANAHISLPLREDLGAQRVDGEVNLDGVDVVDSQWNVAFLDSSGKIGFATEGLQATDLISHFEGARITMALATGSLVRHAGVAAEATMVGTAPASVFASRAPMLTPVFQRIPQASEWSAQLLIPDPKISDDAPRLTLSSELEASDVTLPAPLNKSQGEILPVSITMDLPDIDRLDLTVGQLLALRLKTLDDTWSGTLHFGPGEPRANDNAGLLIEGSVEQLDLDQWQDLIGEFVLSPESSQRWLTSLDLSIAQLRMAHREFSGLTLTTSRDDNYWGLNLVGDQLTGSLRLPLTVDTNRLLLAEFERFEWPASDEEMASPAFHPSVIPPLRFVTESLSFQGVEYGSANFETYPTRDGMHIDHLETESASMQVSASGDWVQTEGAQSSNFAITITGNDLGQILGNFGFSELFDGGQAFVRLDTRWDGAPSDFEMARLGGDLDVRISNGQIMEVQPGAGRIFGLMSLQALPRRLQLDFSDLFKSGLTFDSIEGNFLLDQGNAYTENLAILGPTANIEIKGRTGLADEDYDQLITVIPEVGSTLPLVGALAGGGAGAAAAFLLQNVFGNQIDKISQFHYSVTGTWQDPQVELIGANDQRLELETARLIRERLEQDGAQPRPE